MNLRHVSLVVSVSLASTSAFAMEFAADRSRVALFSFGAGNLPKPDTNTLISGYLYNDWDRLTDSHNNRRANFERIDSQARGATLGYLRVTNQKILGADYALGFVLPYLDVTINHTIKTPNGVKPIQGADDGLVGLVLTPVILEWRKPEKQLFQNIRLNIGIPVGHYDEDNPANVTRDFYSTEVAYQATYNFLPTWEFSGGLSYQYNFRNQHDLHPTVSGPVGEYKNGDMLVMNAAMGKKMGNWTLGVGGYWQEQLSEDEIAGSPEFDGFQLRTLGIGPMMSYRFASLKKPTILHAKFSKGIYSKDGVTGDFLSVFLTYPF